MERPLPIPPFQFPASAIPRRPMGYDRGATEGVFESLAASYEKLWMAHSKLEDRITELEAELTRMREQEPLLREALIEARRMANSTLEEARREAAQIIEEATAEAGQLVDNERRRAEGEIASLRRIVSTTGEQITTFLREALEHSQNGDEPEQLDDARVEHEAQSA